MTGFEIAKMPLYFVSLLIPFMIHYLCGPATVYSCPGEAEGVKSILSPETLQHLDVMQ
jgi:hypothetical protein